MTCVVTMMLTIALSLTIGPPSRALAQPPLTESMQAPSLAPAPGVDSVLDAHVRAVSMRLRCPVCQGESIQDSPAELAAQMKGLVREQLASGKSEREVMDYFLAKYGQWIMLEPRAEGFNLFVYLLPILFIVIGGGAIWVAVRRWTRPMDVPSVTAHVVGPPTSDVPQHDVIAISKTV
jgi:cytochrome c-type biogenesis protein CcmH